MNTVVEAEKKRPPYALFVDGKRFESPKEKLTGTEIKAFVNAPAEYQLFEEESGDTPDKPLANTVEVDLKGETKHFYAVPPATFGSL